MKIKRFANLESDIGWFELCKDKEQDLGQRLKGEQSSNICIGGGGLQVLPLQIL